MKSTEKEKSQSATLALPKDGFLRLRDVLKFIPVSRTKWRMGVKNGEFPQPVKLGRLALYRCEDIRSLIKRIGKGEFQCD